jgi:hypothetical protein
MKEVWNKCEPTSERILHDFKDLRRIYKVIHDANGVVVRSGAKRSGRRYKRLDGKGDTVVKPKRSDRKATLMIARPVHPDAQRGFDSLLIPAAELYAVLEQNVLEADEAIEEAAAALGIPRIFGNDGDLIGGDGMTGDEDDEAGDE